MIPAPLPRPAVLAAVALTALLAAALTAPVLRRLPEPADPGSATGKVSYRSLVSAGFVLACGLASAVAAGVSWTTLPVAVQPLWSVLAVGGVLLAAVDAATTWLPLRLVQGCWAAMALAALVGAAAAGSGSMLLRTALGAAFAGGLYLGVWLLSRGGFGFGDVRFAPLIGAATAAAGWQLLVWGLLVGTVLGAVHGVVHLLRRRADGFPYAPAMLAGAYLAAVLQAVTT